MADLFNEGGLASGLDRDDGTTGFLGQPTPNNSKQVNAGDGSNTITTNEQPDSPTIELGEQATITKKWVSDWNNALTELLALGRGTIEIDSNGNVTRILTSTIQHKHGDIGEISKVSEGLSFDSPPDKFRITAVKMDVNIMKHPRYFYALQGNTGDGSAQLNQSVIRLLQNYMENTTALYRDALIAQLYYSLKNPGTIDGNGIAQPAAAYTPTGQSAKITPIPGTDMAKMAAIEIIQKYWLGIETPYIVGLQIEWISYYFRPPLLNLGGYVENPMTDASPQLPDYFYSTSYPPDPTQTIFDALTLINPQCYSANGLYGGDLQISWLREADTQDEQRTWFEITRTWIGSPIGIWDAQLYSNSNRHSSSFGLFAGDAAKHHKRHRAANRFELKMKTFGGSPIPRTGMPTFHESSVLRSPRDEDATARQYLRNKTIAKQLAFLVESVIKVERDLNKLRLQNQGSNVSTTTFPLQIQLSPPITDSEDASDVAAADGGTVGDGIDRTWRLFRVRAGAVGTTPIENTDQANNNPDDSTNFDNPNYNDEFEFLDFTDDTPVGVDFLVPNNCAAFYVWVDCNDITHPFIDGGTERPGDHTDGSFWTGTYILVATIDTNTNSSSQEAIVRQYRRADIPVASGCDETGNGTTLPV